ncbi:hypothetical protein HMPREF1548_03433 [Clostridium sp. KLE 1755]|nr:hypothetical protein HMPREF1548_03433 [Clostridium sp. KLE 1755]
MRWLKYRNDRENCRKTSILFSGKRTVPKWKSRICMIKEKKTQALVNKISYT